MKPTAILINTARGRLVDDAALHAAMKHGCLRGAGLDVFAQESLAASHPLLKLPNVVLSPYISWLTPESLDRSIQVAVQNCCRLDAEMPPLYEALPISAMRVP